MGGGCHLFLGNRYSTKKLLGGSVGKESACSAGETWVQSPGREGPLEKGMTTHSSIVAWKIPWTEETGGLWGGAGSAWRAASQSSMVWMRDGGTAPGVAGVESAEQTEGAGVAGPLHAPLEVGGIREKSQRPVNSCKHGGNMVRFLSSVRHVGAMAGKASKGRDEGAGVLKAELTRACLMEKCLGVPSPRGSVAAALERSQVGLRHQL